MCYYGNILKHIYQDLLLRRLFLNQKNYSKHKIYYYVALILIILFIIFLILYHYMDFSFYGRGSDCGFKLLLHCYCPGCGGSRALDAFLHGNFLTSLLSHPAIIITFGLFMSYFIPATYTFLIKRNGNLYYKFHPISLWILLIVIVSHFVMRNLLLIVFHIDYLQDCIIYYI